MKTVFPHKELAHIWANQLQEQGHVSNRSMYFEGDTIYSYGGHFPIAKHVGNGKVLFTTDTHSKTTAKHIAHVRNAASHLERIYVYNPRGGSHENFDKFLSKIKRELAGLLNARKPEKYIEPAKYVYQQAIKYAEFLGVPVPNELTELIESVDKGEYKEYLANEAARIAKEQAARECIAHKKAIGDLKKWYKGENVRLYARHGDRDHLRIIERMEDKKHIKRIETSQGIEMPLEVARKAYNWVKLTIQAGGCNGDCHFKILDYEVTALTSKLMTIGCHKIEMKEIEKIATILNWNV